MAKPKSNKTTGVRSTIWDTRLGAGEQHTIYAPPMFFRYWTAEDKALKKYINDYLLTREGLPIAPPVFAGVSDDDI